MEELVGVDAISSLHDSVFCVHLQRQYSAARELNAFLEKYGMDVKNVTEESELKYLTALEVQIDSFFPETFRVVIHHMYPYREEQKTKTN